MSVDAGRSAIGAAPDLISATAELVAIPSVSHSEKALADHIERLLSGVGHLEVTRIGENVIGRVGGGAAPGGEGPGGEGRQRIVLAGHIDTVPANGNTQPRVDGDTLWGLGSADMKGGLAVMIALAAAVDSPAVDVTYVFYAGEEVAREHNGLLEIERSRPDLLSADAAVLGEPTGARIEAGCQGVLRLQVTVTGARAHTARPWMGVNAIHRLGPVLERVAAYEGRRPVIDGCEYREALQAVQVSGGVAGNVVPDAACVVLNHRFAPDRDAETAEAHLRELLEPAINATTGDTIEMVEAQPAASPSLDQPLLARLLDATGAPARAKLGWTDVAFFAERGVPAVNFGPGDPELAHRADERVTAGELARTYESLRKVLTTS